MAMVKPLPEKLSQEERHLCKVLGSRSKFYVFLRHVRPLLLDETMSHKLASMYGERRGKKRVRPHLLVLTMLLQAHTGVSDAGAIDCIAADLRWRMVLGLPLEPGASPFSQKTLVFFRRRLVEHGLDALVVDSLARLAGSSGLFDARQVRTFAFASSPAPIALLKTEKRRIQVIWRAARGLYRVALDTVGPHLELVVAAAQPPLSFMDCAWPRIAGGWTDQAARRELQERVERDALRLRRLLRPHLRTYPQDSEVRIACRNLGDLVRASGPSKGIADPGVQVEPQRG